MFDIRRYTTEQRKEWDEFVCNAKNSTFLCQRNYMDYHADRFSDFSLMFYHKNKLYAILPANVRDNTLYSHQGLTYGGLIMSNKCTAAEVLTLFKEMNAFLKNNGINKVVYKPIPQIYCTVPAEEDLYALFRCNATIIARGISTCIDMQNPIKWRTLRVRSAKKAETNGVTVEEINDIHDFWHVLTNNLMEKHHVMPVHKVEEMELLMSRFPDNIRLMQARNNKGDVLAGMLLFITDRVIHTQYISATEEGKQLGALDAIVKHLTSSFSTHYVDFGVSTEDGGMLLNESLIFQKEGFGGRGICYDIYEYEI